MRDEGLEQPIDGFTFFTTSETWRLLRNHNLVFRPTSSGFTIYYCSSDLIPIKDKVRFTFGFRYSNNSLYKNYGITKPEESDPFVYGPSLIFDNLSTDGSIINEQGASLAAAGSEPDKSVGAEDTGYIFNQTFTLIQSAAGDVPAQYVLKPRYNPLPEQTIPVNTSGNAQSVQTLINSVDMGSDYLGETGLCTLTSDSPSSSRNIYLHDELKGRSARGVVDIYWNTAQNSVAEDTGQQYYITFKPK